MNKMGAAMAPALELVRDHAYVRDVIVSVIRSDDGSLSARITVTNADGTSDTMGRTNAAPF